MQQRFKLADKLQYVSKLLARQTLAVGDMERFVFGQLRESNDFMDGDFDIIERWFRPLRDALFQSHAAIYDVLNATDAKRASAVVKGIYTVRGSKLN